jgi:hypothetical protein
MPAKELPIPPAVASDAKAIELLRVWAAHGQQHISLATNIWKDPATCGIMLVDLAKLIADAYHQTTGKDSLSILKRIRDGFDVEWGNPTDEPSGKLLDGPPPEIEDAG